MKAMKTGEISKDDFSHLYTETFLAAADWGGQRDGQICIWGEGQEFRIPLMHD